MKLVTGFLIGLLVVAGVFYFHCLSLGGAAVCLW